MPGSATRIGLLFGGTWDERPISIASAHRVLLTLRAAGLPVQPIRWDAGGWVVLDPEIQDLNGAGVPLPPPAVIHEQRTLGVGVMFLALHGGPGEDGTVQGFLETCGMPYTGAGVHGSAMAGNKETFRQMARGLGFEVAPGMVLSLGQWLSTPGEVLTSISVEIGFPLVTKPLASGSSFGVRRSADAGELQDALDALFEHEREVLVERFIAGRELSIPCLGTRTGAQPQVLPIAEIEPLTSSGIFDIEAKYVAGRAREIIPAPLEPDLRLHLERMILRLHERLDLGAMSRTDLVLGADGPVLLETNTIPGLTGESILPKAAAVAGLDFLALLRRIIDHALSAHLARGAGYSPAPAPRST